MQDKQITIVLISIAIIAIGLLYVLPKMQLRSARRSLKNFGITLADLLKAENDRRVTIAQILGGLAVLAGLFYSSRTVRLQENGQLTDRINKAVEQLGQKSVPVNLGGIHQLGRIAADYDEERFPMLQILANFLEVNADLPESLKIADCNAFEQRKFDGLPAPASQAVVTVLMNQVPRLPKSQYPLEINHTNLQNVDFSGGQLGTIQLAGDDLRYAHFTKSHLNPGSLLSSSLFMYADLSESDFSGVLLHHACMSKARLRNTILAKADLTCLVHSVME